MSGDNKKNGTGPGREKDDPRPAEKQLVLARDILPDHLPVIPIVTRPLSPKMIVPLVIDDPRGKRAVQEVLQANARGDGTLCIETIKVAADKPASSRPASLAA